MRIGIFQFVYYLRINAFVEQRRSNNEQPCELKRAFMIQGTSTYYFVYNGHGDVTSLTDSSGAVVATYSYDEFGNITNETGNIYNSLRYSGAHNAYYDSETSLYKMGTRYYQPDIGRWLTRDSYIGEQQELQSRNRYIYVENNPVAYFDDTGHKKKKWPLIKKKYARRRYILPMVTFPLPPAVWLKYWAKLTEYEKSGSRLTTRVKIDAISEQLKYYNCEFIQYAETKGGSVLKVDKNFSSNVEAKGTLFVNLSGTSLNRIKLVQFKSYVVYQPTYQGATYKAVQDISKIFSF